MFHKANTPFYMSSTINTSILIIGAGPAGLAVAGRLRKLGLEFEMVEQTHQIASKWHEHYDRLCLHTVKQLSALPHLPLPDEYPTYVPRHDLVRYYEHYASQFEINPHFGLKVHNITRQPDGRWLTECDPDQRFTADSVVVATGTNRVPYSPVWPGQELFEGDIVHSFQYKNADPYLGKRVLIVGMGNTGAEIALDLAESGAKPYLSVRSPVNIVPRDINGRPTQLTARQLAKLPFGIGDWLGTQIRRLIVGDLRKYGLETASIPPAVQLRTTGKTPVIDLGTVAQIKAGTIKVLPDIDHFSSRSLLFKDGREKEFDAVILATGYRAQLEDFIPGIRDWLDEFGLPKGNVGKGAFLGLYFAGFDNYKLGGLLGTIFTDSEVIAKDLQTRNARNQQPEPKMDSSA